MEVINSFIGLSFTVAVLSILLLPIWVAIEKGVNSYLKWSTIGNVGIETPLKKLWNKLFSFEMHHKSYTYTHNLEFPVALIPVLFYIPWIVGIVYDTIIKNYELIPTIIKIVVSPILYVGTAIAPILMVILPFIGFSLVLRKIFKFKEEIEDRLSK